METLFRNDATESEILLGLDKIKITESDLDRVMSMNLHPSQFAYVQALHRLAMNGDMLQLSKINEKKRSVFGLKPQMISGIYHKNRLVIEGDNKPLDALLKTINVTYNGAASSGIDDACKQLSSSSHKYGIIVINNVLGTTVEYDISNLVNKNIPYYKGLNKTVIDELQPIRVASKNAKVNVSVKIHNKEFNTKSRCLYYVIETLDGKLYHFLKLPAQSIPIDSSILFLEWCEIERSYNSAFETLLLEHVSKNIVLNKFCQNKYDINFADMSQNINDSIFSEFADIKSVNIHELIKYTIDKLIDYISAHVSSMEKNEIYSVLISMKYKIKKALFFEFKDVFEKTLTPLELNIKIYEIIFKTLSDSDLFDHLYFKEKMLE
jgi:hypothetical protein